MEYIYAPGIKLFLNIFNFQPTLGVTRSSTALLFVVIGPVGPYFPTGMKPVKLLADPKFVRAWPGGCGGYKMGSYVSLYSYDWTINFGLIDISRPLNWIVIDTYCGH